MRLAIGVLGLGLAFLASCDETPKATLAVHWSINGDASAAACQNAGVNVIRVFAAHMNAEPENDNPVNPDWPYADFDCQDLSGRLTLGEGIYRVRLAGLDASGQLRSEVVEFVDVELVAGHTTSLPLDPQLEPPIEIEVAICGDGVVQSSEWCDATDLAGQDCLSRGYDGGTLSCDSTCQLVEDGCHRCGDGVLNGDESCDGSELGGQSCQGLGLEGGPLTCAADCTWDRTSCLGCGNGIVEAGEVCDDGNQDAGDGCSPDCLLEQGPVTVAWTVWATGKTLQSDCATEAIDEVEITLIVAGVGSIVHQARLPCTAGQLTVADVPYGLYSAYLTGLDTQDASVAAGASSVIDHSQTAGTTVSVDLVAF